MNKDIEMAIASLCDDIASNTDANDNLKRAEAVLTLAFSGIFAPDTEDELDEYEDPALVCMAYNLGEYGASVLWDKGVYETSYSRKVLSVADEYEAQRGGTDV